MHESDDQVPLSRVRTLTAFASFAHFVLVLALPYVVGALTGRSGVDVAQSSRALIGLELVIGLAVVVTVATIATVMVRKPAARAALIALPLAPAFLVIAFAAESAAERRDAQMATLDVFSLGALTLAVMLSAAALAIACSAIRRWSTATFWVVFAPGSAVVVVFLLFALRLGACVWVVSIPALVGTVSVAISAASAGESLTRGDGVAARESTSTGLLASAMALTSVALASVAAGALDVAVHARAGSVVDALTARTVIASSWMVALGIVSALVGGFSRRTALVGLATSAVRAPLVIVAVCAIAVAVFVRGSFRELANRFATPVHASVPLEHPIVPARSIPTHVEGGSATLAAVTAEDPPPRSVAAVSVAATADVPPGTIQSVSGNGVTIRVLAVGGGGLLLTDAVTGLAHRVDLFSRCATDHGTIDLRVFVDGSGGVTALKPRGAASAPAALATCTMLALYKVGFAPHGGMATVDVQFDY